MVINGIVEKVKAEANPPKAKALINDSINQNSSWWIEFRKDLRHAANLLKAGDNVIVECYNEGRESKTNTHNNVIATSLKRT